MNRLNKIDILDNEIKIDICIKRDLLLNLLIFFITPISIISIFVLIFENYNSIINPFYYVIICFFLFIVSSVSYKNILWRFKGVHIITIDSKYIIINKSMLALSIYEVFKIDEISKTSIDHDFTYSLWTRIKSFWTRSEGGCVNFLYRGKLVRIGNGLSVVEADELISALKEKQILKDLNF